MTMQTHCLPPDELTRTGDLMVFNWLPAAYAHDDWLGIWAQAMNPREQVSRRTLCRASAALVERHGLASRYLTNAHQAAWLLLPDESLRATAVELGCAMLGGWVRNGLQREDVARQRSLLSPNERATALGYAARLSALPYPSRAWPLSAPDGAAVLCLGVSCMTHLLSDRHDGAAQRLALRFPAGTAGPLVVTDEQRSEAFALLTEMTARHALEPGWLDRLQWGTSG